jgi:CHASE1-domain containing sensor protein
MGDDSSAPQRSNLMRRIATIDDDEMAAPFLVELQAPNTQQKQRQRERNDVDAEHRSWQLAKERLNDL